MVAAAWARYRSLPTPVRYGAKFGKAVAKIPDDLDVLRPPKTASLSSDPMN